MWVTFGGRVARRCGDIVRFVKSVVEAAFGVEEVQDRLPTGLSRFRTSAEQIAFIKRILKVFDAADMHEGLFWRVDRSDSPEIVWLALCNDVFWWATADVEEITPENIGILEQTLRDLEKLEEVRPRLLKSDSDLTNASVLDYILPLTLLCDLFAARSRKMRPQSAYYREMRLPLEIASMFDACGPERDRADEG